MCVCVCARALCSISWWPVVVCWSSSVHCCWYLSDRELREMIIFSPAHYKCPFIGFHTFPSHIHTHTHIHINTLSLSTLLWTIWMIFKPGIITQQVCLSWLRSISSGLMHNSSSWSDVLPSLARRKVQLSRKPIRFHQLALISRGKLVLAAVLASLEAGITLFFQIH